MKDHSSAQVLEERVESVIGDFLEDFDFQWHSSLHQYRRETNLGFQCVILAFSHYEDLSLLEAHVGIRLDAVENLAFPFTNNPAGFRGDSMTLVTPLARLFGRRHERHELATEKEADAAARQIVQQLESEGLPFINRYFNLRRMDALFNEAPEKLLPYLHNATNRCLRGITLARLTQRDDFEALVRACRQQLRLQFATEAAIARFEQLVNILRTFSEN